jgi:glycine cleavage system H protein
MAKSYAILPCNGLDKCAGRLAGELAIRLAQKTDSEIICPVLYRQADARYNKIAHEKPLLVIDGCATRCASKLAAEKGLKISEKVNITEAAKANKLKLSKGLNIGDNELKLAEIITERLTKEAKKAAEENAFSFTPKLDYEIYAKDKFTFRLPQNGFFFNENDCWAYIYGNRARIGVTDYVQKSLSDIIFFTPPSIGTVVEQFDAAGELESGKAVFEVISPVSGKIIAINEKLVTAPELINESPYEQGWIAEIELTDFTADKELLLEFSQYFAVMKRKVDKFHV